MTDTDTDMNSTESLDIDTDTNMYTDKYNSESMESSDIDVDNLIRDFEKVSFFGDQKVFMELYNNSKIEISDFETDEEIEIVLDKTFKRYRTYLKNIGYMDKDIIHDLEKFIRKFQDYENVYDTELFKFMNYIDNKILDKIVESKEENY